MHNTVMVKLLISVCSMPVGGLSHVRVVYLVLNVFFSILDTLHISLPLLTEYNDAILIYFLLCCACQQVI